MKIHKVNSLCSMPIILLLTLLTATSCKKDVDHHETDNIVICGTVTARLDFCSGNGLVLSVSTPHDIGTDAYDTIYGKNAIMIPNPVSVFLDGSNIDRIRVNYRMFNGKPVALGEGDFVVLECRPYRHSSGDTMCYYHTSLCPMVYGPPNIDRYVVAKVLSVH